MTQKTEKEWLERMANAYPADSSVLKYVRENFPAAYARLAPKYKIDKKAERKVWMGSMSEEARQRHDVSYEMLDRKAELLLAKGYRLVKSSAFSEKGIYDSFNTAPRAEAPNGKNMFFEQKINGQEFLNLYEDIGMRENNFPDYFKGQPEAFLQYAQKSDIWILEDIKTNQPVGFASFQKILAGTPEAKDMADDGIPVKDVLIYNDTVAILGKEMQGKGVGGLMMDIIDSYYVKQYGVEAQYALCTGEINTNAQNVLALGFHEKRGFGDWVESAAPMKKWLDRYQPIAEKVKKGKVFKQGTMNKSYARI